MKPDQEAIQRLRRIETRLVRYFDHVGFDCGMRKPVWDNGRIELSSPDSSLKDMLAVIPKNYQGNEIDVVLKGVVVCNIVEMLEE
jgi:hypothetical protein